MHDEPLYQVKNIQRRFFTGETVSYFGEMSIHLGRLTLITGSSGVGKSTLLHTLALLNRALPSDDGGSVFQLRDVTALDDVSKDAGPIDLLAAGGADLDRLRQRFNQRSFGFLPQSGHLLEHLSVIENLSLVAHLRGVPAEDLRAEIQEVLKLVELTDELLIDGNGLGNRPTGTGILSPRRWWQRMAGVLRGTRQEDPEVALGRSPRFLSGGQARRLAVARALIGAPKVLFVDEPLIFLDDELFRKTMGVFLDCVTGSQCAMIVVTHQFDKVIEAIGEYPRSVKVDHYALNRRLSGRADLLGVEIADRTQAALGQR